MHDLRSVPLFAALNEDALDAIQARLKLRRFRKGEIVMRQGAIGDTMYIIRSGQVQVVREGENGDPETIITHLGPGVPVGELAPLLNERRSATVRVAIDAELWELSKADLDALANAYPAIALAIAQELARRVRRTTERPSETDTLNLIAVMGSDIPRLAHHLQRFTGESVLLLDLGGLRPEVPTIPESVSVEQMDDDTTPDELSSRLGQLVSHYGRVLMAIPRHETHLTRKAAEQAEVVIELGGRSTTWVKRFARNGTYWYHNIENASIPKVARKIARKRIGLALSSGNARSIAHIGVLKALEDAGISIDVMAGTSGGGLFGALYGVGWDIQNITAFAKDLSRIYSYQSLSALNFPFRTGIVSGKWVQRLLARTFDDKSFEDSKIPLRIIAADVITGEEVVFRDGPLAEAVQATVSSVPLMEPARSGSRWLIDGAAVNPVPVSVVRDDVDIVIASSVIVSLQERVHRKTMQQTGRLPNLVALTLGKEEIMEAGLIQNRLGRVDALIEPDVTLFEGFDFHRADEFIARGMEAAAPVVASLKRVLEPPPKRDTGPMIAIQPRRDERVTLPEPQAGD
jgi:NTE family protein